MVEGSNDASAVITTKRSALGQVTLCKGCCCGLVEKGYPNVPVDRIKAAWKAGKLNKAIQLTISGCVGPCDVPNVAVISTSAGTTWLGGLTDDAAYDALLEWAQACSTDGRLVELPATLSSRKFEYFRPSPAE